MKKGQITTIALFACLVVGIAWYSSKQSPPNNRQQPTSSHTNESGKDDTGGDSPGIPSVESIPREDRQNLSQTRTEKGNWYQYFSEHPTEWLLVLFNFGLVIFNGLLWRSTAGLRAVAEQQSRDFVRSIEATEKTAAAALKSADTAEKDLLASHKPLVTISNLELREDSSAEARPHISFSLRNSGKGLAIVHKVGVTVQTIDRGKKERIRFAASDWSGAIESGEASDGHRLVTDIVGIIEYNLIKNGQMALFVNFEVLGQDIFKNSTRQVFAFVYNLRSWKFERAPSQWTEEQQNSGE